MSDIITIASGATDPMDERQRALRLYRSAVAAQQALRFGLDRSTAAAMCGLDDPTELDAALSVVAHYKGERSFLAAYDIHEPPIGYQRSWESLVAVVGSEASSRDPVELAEDVRRAVRLYVNALTAASPTPVNEESLVRLQQWMSRTLPPTPMATDAVDYFGYADCAFCGERNGAGKPREVHGVMVPCCEECSTQSEEMVDWLSVVLLYKAYAHECYRESEILRNRY